MNTTAIKLATVLAAALFFSVWAGRTGLGSPRPTRNPPSLREESARQGALGRGHHRTRYFVGGGFMRGK